MLLIINTLKFWQGLFFSDEKRNALGWLGATRCQPALPWALRSSWAGTPGWNWRFDARGQMGGTTPWSCTGARVHGMVGAQLGAVECAINWVAAWRGVRGRSFGSWGSVAGGPRSNGRHAAWRLSYSVVRCWRRHVGLGGALEWVMAGSLELTARGRGRGPVGLRPVLQAQDDVISSTCIRKNDLSCRLWPCF